MKSNKHKMYSAAKKIINTDILHKFMNADKSDAYISIYPTDHNDCDPTPCQHGSCVDKVNGFVCNCHPGYQGTICDIGK